VTCRSVELHAHSMQTAEYATHRCGDHLHFTGTEPAVGLRPRHLVLWTHVFHSLLLPSRVPINTAW